MAMSVAQRRLALPELVEPGAAESSAPAGRGRVVAAGRAGADGVAQQPAQRRVDRRDPVDGGGDGLADGDPGALVRATRDAGPPAEPGGRPQLVEQRVALAVEAFLPGEVGVRPGLGQLVVELGQPASVGREGLAVEQRARVAVDGPRAALPATASESASAGTSSPGRDRSRCR